MDGTAVVSLLFSLNSVCAHPLPPEIAEVANAPLEAHPAELRWWREAKFGLFIHWGPVSLKGTEIGWSRGGERRGRRGRGQIPAEVYDNLYKRFDPVKFNAKEWVEIAKAAGMKYLVFTTKHHDGFSMFDSALTDYKITNSPFQRDVTAELARACHEGGIRLGFYYSPPDWYHSDYRTENHARYIRYLHGQLRELCTKYGRVDILWFDGLGGKPGDWDSERLIPVIRRLQPGILINNRAGLPCDFDTPEQRVGRFNNERAWESCITICRQWAWKPEDDMKSLKQCIHTLVKCVGGDGNLLLNVGPMPSGEIEPRQVSRLKEIGAWLEKYGESVYGTRGGPFRPGAWGASTQRENTIYLHVLNWPGEKAGITLPTIDRQITASSTLTGGKAILKPGENGVEVFVSPENRSELATIVVLRLDGPAGDINPVSLTSSSLTAGKRATASNVYMGNQAYSAGKAVDDDDATRWATDAGVKEAWLEVDLGTTKTFDRARVSEEYGRVRQFELLYKKGESWVPFVQGTRIGSGLELEFSPVTARFVRLAIHRANDGPTIWEFQLFAPRKK